MLILAGLGLYDEKDLTLREIEEARTADKVYLELYTSKWFGDSEKLKSVIGREVIQLTRKELEEEGHKLIEEARDKKVVLFVPGDPLVATTHLALVSAARNEGIRVKIFHNSSIISAVAETGLHVYKFGPSVTIPFPEKTRGLPESVYNVIKINKARGLHTLCLLDVDTEENKFMTANQGMEILLDIEGKRREEVFTKHTKIVVFARAGSDDPLIVYGKVEELIEEDFGSPPMALVVPGILHFTERKYLKFFSPPSR